MILEELSGKLKNYLLDRKISSLNAFCIASSLSVHGISSPVLVSIATFRPLLEDVDNRLIADFTMGLNLAAFSKCSGIDNAIQLGLLAHH